MLNGLDCLFPPMSFEPQAFTHLALISAATYLDRALSGTEGAQWK